MNRSPAFVGTPMRAAFLVRGARSANGLLDLDCGTADAKGSLVIDRETQRVLGTRAGHGMQTLTGAATAVDALCSDGVQTRRGQATVG